ncbi:MAG TPA: hypothetical protein VJ347_00305 [Streptosporangiaceae bacterium]|nr:hypothetical protein [Streptosporangiaceae bacterium]
MPGQTAGWDRLRLRLRSAAPPLYLPAPRLAGSPAADCEVCRGPVRPGFARCYQCDRHALLGPALLADAVVPISYAIKGTPFADHLWRYKSVPVPSSPAPPPASAPAPASSAAVTPASAPTPASARASVLALLLAFLTDHGPCVWQRASMPPPDQLAVVPTGAGRPGPHPLLRLVSPYLRLPGCSLVLRPGRQGRDLDLDRFQVQARPAGASVLLLDDTWVSGASAQSAAAALKLAGARHVAVVVLGRHVNPDDAASAPLLAGLAAARYDPSACAVHPLPNGTNRR